MRRELTAVLAADIVGCSKHMGDDERGTLTALREVQASAPHPEATQHRGETENSTGDGWLISFASTQDAARHASTPRPRGATSSGCGPEFILAT